MPIRVRLRRRSVTVTGKKTFVQAGVGRHGPYAVARRQVSRHTGIKATTGTRGTTLGADRRIGRKTRVGAGYNFTHSKPYAEIKRKRRVFRV